MEIYYCDISEISTFLAKIIKFICLPRRDQPLRYARQENEQYTEKRGQNGGTVFFQQFSVIL